MATSVVTAVTVQDTQRVHEVLPIDPWVMERQLATVLEDVGADAIKTRYSGDPDSFREAVIGAGRPILVAGGPRRDSSVESMLRLVEEVLEAGASGVVFGRLIWQQEDPLAALRAVCAMVQDDATFDEALEIVAG